MRRRWLGRLALLGGGLLIGLVAAELAARLISPHAAADILFQAPDNAPQGMYVNDPELVFVPKAGFEATSRSLGYAVQLRFNALALRGPEVEAATGPRWLAVGDSFTLSPQVSEAETFSGRLAASQGMEVWNAGVDGYSTWQATRRYQRVVDALQPDGVLLTYFLGNDLQDNQRFQMELSRARQRPAGQVIYGLPVPFWQRALMRWSFIYGQWRVHQRLVEMERPDSPERQRWQRELLPFTRRGGGQINALIGDTTSALEELSRRVSEHRDRLMVAVAPPAFAVDPSRLASTFELVGLDPAEADLHAPGQAVLQVLAKLHIPACDLMPALEAAQAKGQQLYFTWDGHWTPDGHAVVAEALGACLRESGLSSP